LDFSIKASAPDKAKTDCIVAGVHEGGKLTAAGSALDKASGKRLTEVLRRGDMTGKANSTALLYDLPAIASPRVLLLGLGKQRDMSDKDYREVLRAGLRALADIGARHATLALTDVAVAGRDTAWKVEHAALVGGEVAYRFDEFKSNNERPKPALQEVSVLVASENKGLHAAIDRGNAIVSGIELAKNLGNTPPNVCTPAYLADQARMLGKVHGLKVEVLEQKDMEKLGMGSFLAVARGSRNPPKFIVMHHHGAGNAKPFVLVGKGITFDTGGISIKSAPDMDEMKFDMSGAGSVFGTMKAVALMKLKLNVIGVIPTCENMPDGNATRPGDIVKSMSGQTIEILNTDAEGRLILCDALTYCERFSPQAVVDIATLTGACVIALGHVAAAVYSNKNQLAQSLIRAGDHAHDRVWHMPLWDDYQDQLRSNFADVANIGGRPAGSVTAACFLSRFAKKFDWAHLDIAGTAYKSGREKGSTGRPVGLLTHYLIDRAGK
jgi:leucyl aminopeptidase